jgi:hypothetical protein
VSSPPSTASSVAPKVGRARSGSPTCGGGSRRAAHRVGVCRGRRCSSGRCRPA